MVNYTLTYFEGRGLAEPIRWIFAYTGVPYSEVRIPNYGLTELKKSELGLDWGQLPILEIDGKQFAQSKAIARYLAKKFNLVGRDEFEEFKCDEIVEAVVDYTNLYSPIFRATDANKKKALIETVQSISPVHLARFNAVLERNGTGWAVGKGFTWADVFIGHAFNHMETCFDIDLKLRNYPALFKTIQNVQALPGIKEWLENRPPNQIVIG